MKRTMGLVILPCFFQLDVTSDNINNIQPVFDFVNWSHELILVKILISVKKILTIPLNTVKMYLCPLNQNKRKEVKNEKNG